MNIEDYLSLDQQIMAGLCLMIVLLFFYIQSKTKEHAKKIHVLAKSLGEAQRHAYEFEMRLNEKFKELQAAKAGLSIIEVETLVDISASNHLTPLNKAISEIVQEIEAFKDEYKSRLSYVENSVKGASMPRSSVGGADDRKILQLYNAGKSVEMIAKELHVSTPEVEFALKLADLR